MRNATEHTNGDQWEVTIYDDEWMKKNNVEIKQQRKNRLKFCNEEINYCYIGTTGTGNIITHTAFK